MIKLIIWRENVTLNNGKWKSKHKILNNLLKHFTYVNIREYTPFLDLSLAELVVKELGGKIVKIINPPKFVKGRIY